MSINIRTGVKLTVGWAAIVSFAAWAAAAETGDTLSLAGPWRVQLDRGDLGCQQGWFRRGLADAQPIPLPGSLPGCGIGDDVTVDTHWTGGIVDRAWFTAPEYAPYRQPGHIKVPFWLQPEKYYAGAAWYQREVEIPAAWTGRRVWLTLERLHWQTTVWIDDAPAGSNNSLSTPHEYDLGPLAAGKHRLTVRVDNRMVVDVGENSHSVSDHTQGNWNGIVGRVELRARAPLWIDQQRVFPNPDGTVRVEVTVGNVLPKASGSLVVTIRARGGAAAGTATARFDYRPAAAVNPDGTAIRVTHDRQDIVVKLDRPPTLWSEFTPALYEAETRLETADGKSADTATSLFGFRQLATAGTQFTLNGLPIFFRGTLECCIFPKTGHPPTDLESWRRIVGVAKAHGLNMIRFHSWCPPEAAFVAADELGFYYHVECASWANQSTTIGDGKPIDTWIYDEADRILRAYGNHPSFLLMLYGNEPGGKHHAAFLAKWVEHYKARDTRRLYSSAAGWPLIPENQFHVTPQPRIQAWGGGLRSRINARPPETRTDYRDYIAKYPVPVVSHEIGQWCVYPNFAEIPKYTGYLKPRNFEIFRDWLTAHHLADQAQQFVWASGKLQALCYKEDIESALRTPGMGGFQLLDLHDFPGQGTALVGVLDPFWEGKGYVTPAEFRRFAGSTVPLARLDKRVFSTAETLAAAIEVANFGPAPLRDATVDWKLVDDAGHAAAQGRWPGKTIPIGNGLALGTVNVELRDVPAPRRYRLVVGIENTAFENDWDVWVYPPRVETPAAGVQVVDSLNDAALRTLADGGKVLLLIPPACVKGDAHGRVALGFSSIFWNTAWTHRQPPHTLGILCDPRHSALADFPTDACSNWQWWYLVSRAGAMILDDLPPALRPTVQVIDDWFTARRLGLVFEARLGKGALLVCSIDLAHDLEQNPVARQMRHSLLTYMGSERFKPSVEVTAAQINGLMAPPSQLQKLGAKITADSFEPGYEPSNVADGNPATLWHTRWQPQPAPMPHYLLIDLGREVALRGLTYLPRSDLPNGRITRCQVFCGNDPQDFGPPAAQAEWPGNAEPKVLRFPQTIKARYVKFLASREVKGQPFASAAEIDVLVDEQ